MRPRASRANTKLSGRTFCSASFPSCICQSELGRALSARPPDAFRFWCLPFGIGRRFGEAVAFFRRAVGGVACIGAAQADAILKVPDPEPSRIFASAGLTAMLALRGDFFVVH